jgi:hypothetical protein
MSLSLDGTTGISASGNITGGNVIASGSLIVGSFAPTSLSTTGNVTGGNVLTGGLVSATSTVTGSSLLGSVVSVTGNITGGNVLGGANVNATTHTGSTVNVTANITGGNILTGGIVSATGNITGSYLFGNASQVTGLSSSAITNGTSNVNVTSSGGNVTVGVGGTSNVGVFATTGVYVTGAVSASGTVTAASTVGGVITGSSSSVTGTQTAASTVGGVITGSSVSVSGTVTGANVTTAGQLTVNSGANVTAIVNGATSGVGNIGSSTTPFNTVFAKATTAQYADLAEMHSADTFYEPGTVVEFGGESEITQSSSSHSTRVAGIVSTDPSYLMNAGQQGSYVLPVALTGRVPCRVIGSIAKGDRLVASGTPGVATVLDMAQYQPGCILGKSLEAYNSDQVGTIEVSVGRF